MRAPADRRWRFLPLPSALLAALLAGAVLAPARAATAEEDFMIAVANVEDFSERLRPIAVPLEVLRQGYGVRHAFAKIGAEIINAKRR